MTVVTSLGASFGLCLLIVLAADAVRRGRRLYIPAVLGLGVALLGRMASGAMLASVNTILQVGGLTVALAVLIIDLLFEEVEVSQEG